jgi:drug/metabolite transporter (DMT)-like permease
LAATALLGTALVWGASFTAVKEVVEAMPATDFLALRFTLAAVVLLACRPRALRRVGRGPLWHGVALGIVLATGYLCQTLGLEHTTPAVSGVLTGLLVALAALMAELIRRQRLPMPILLALVLGAGGLGVVVLGQGGFGVGVVLTLTATVLLAGHLVGLAAWSDVDNVWALLVVQLLMAATVLAALAAQDGLTTPPNLGVWAAVLLTGVLAFAAATLVQVAAQRQLSPAAVGVLLAAEPVFAILVAVTLGDDVLTLSLFSGGALVVSSMVVTALQGRAG